MKWLVYEMLTNVVFNYLKVFLPVLKLYTYSDNYCSGRLYNNSYKSSTWWGVSVI